MEDKVLLAVNGTLMRGLELESNLTEAGATFVMESQTEEAYRLYSIKDKYPAMIKGDNGKAIDVEVYEITEDGMNQVLEKEPEGLTIENIKLIDGQEVYGVVAEPFIVKRRKDITKYQGWRKYLAHLKKTRFVPLIVQAGVIALLVGLFFILGAIKSNPESAEAMTRSVARWYGAVATFISKIFDFVSLTELLFVFLGVLGIVLFVKFIRCLIKGKFIKGFSKLLTIGIITIAVIDTYHISCEAAYNRKPVPLPYYTEETDGAEFVDIYNYYIDDINYCSSVLPFQKSGDVVNYMTIKDITSEVKKAYKIIEGNSYYNPYFGSTKSMISSFIYREFQITGVTFSPLGEANINYLIPVADIPFTIAHELAHTKGVMREDEANQLAFYVCLNSEHPYLRFSAYGRYFYLMRSLTTKTYLNEDQRTNQLHKAEPQLSRYESFEYKFWKEHDLLAKIGDFFNNLYIKSSGVKEGTTSYNGGTSQPPSENPQKPIKPNNYQGLFFEKYYRNK